MGRLRSQGALALLLIPFLAAQTIFKMDVKLVRLLVTAKDSSGKLVGGLEKEIGRAHV